MIGLVRKEEAGRTGERGTCWLQTDSAAAFYTVRRPLVQTATGQDDDAALPDVGKNHDLCGHNSGDHDKTLDAAASCKEPTRGDVDSFDGLGGIYGARPSL